MRRGLLGVLAIGGVVAVAGCAAPESAVPSGSAVVDVAGDVLPVPATLPCAGPGLVYDVDTDAVRSARPATELSPASLALVTSRELGPNSVGITLDVVTEEWFIVEESAEQVVLMRPHHLSAGEMSASTPTFDLRAFLVDTPQPEDLYTWFPAWMTSCTLALDLGELEAPDVALDPAWTAAPDATSIDLLVHERACNNGEDAKGRIEVVALRETSDTVEIVVGITPREFEDEDGMVVVTCPGNPPTPFTVELDEVLGERGILNAGRFPASAITVDEMSSVRAEYTASGMLHVRNGHAQVCSGVAESYPPGCAGGITVHGVKGVELERVRDVAWGDFTLTGTYEDGVLSVTRPAEPLATVRPPVVVEPMVPPGADLSEEELWALADEIFTAPSGPRHLGGAVNPEGWVDVLVPLDAEGLIQAWFDSEYGDGVVRVVSWLRPVSG